MPNDPDVDALFDELDKTAITFPLRGETFILPGPGDWPDGAIEAVKDDDIVGLARALFGEQYDRFVAVGGRASRLTDVFKMVYGVDLGELSASSNSSESTAGQLKPTS